MFGPGILATSASRLRTALIGNVKNVRYLITVGADIESKDAGGSTRLHRAYAAACGYQALRKIEGHGETTVDRAIVHESVFESVTSSLGNDEKELFKHEFSPEMMQTYENIVRETPPGHDSFYQISHGFAAGMDSVYDTMATSYTTVQQQTLKDISETFPHLRFDRANKRIEINIPGLLHAQSQKTPVLSCARAEGQIGRTYLPPSSGRDTVYLLLEKGTNPTAINNIGYSPECYAHHPAYIRWNMKIRLADRVGYEPQSCFCKSQW